jgi:hypothetical protein
LLYRSKTRRALTVVMAGVCREHRPQVRFAVDQHPVGALRPHGAHPPLGIAIGSQRPRRDLDCFHVFAGEDFVEYASEPSSTPVAEFRNPTGMAAAKHIEIISGCCKHRPVRRNDS